MVGKEASNHQRSEGQKDKEHGLHSTGLLRCSVWYLLDGDKLLCGGVIRQCSHCVFISITHTQTQTAPVVFRCCCTNLYQLPCNLCLGSPSCK